MNTEKCVINIEEIMAEIRREIEEKGYKNEDVSFSDIPVLASSGDITHSGTLKENLRILRAHSGVAAYRPLRSNRALGALIVFVKKVIRKLVKFYVEPIVTDQNENNRLVSSCLQDLYLDMESLRLKTQELEDENTRLKRELETYKGK